MIVRSDRWAILVRISVANAGHTSLSLSLSSISFYFLFCFVHAKKRKHVSLSLSLGRHHPSSSPALNQFDPVSVRIADKSDGPDVFERPGFPLREGTGGQHGGDKIILKRQNNIKFH